MARIWKDFPKRVFEEFDGTKRAASGAGVLAGLVIGGPIGATVGGIGAGAVFFGYSIFKAWPVLLKDANLFVGNTLELSSLSDLHPKLRCVGAVGVSRVGKTTLQSHICSQIIKSNDRTEQLYARVSVLPSRPPKLFALIDGAGQQFSQQFKIFDEAEILIVCLDHNESDNSSAIDQTRLAYQASFMQQLIGHMKRSRKHPARMHFILNKRDQRKSENGTSNIDRWFNDIVVEWKNIPEMEVTHSEHSNFVATDMMKIVTLLSSWLGK